MQICFTFFLTALAFNTVLSAPVSSSSSYFNQSSASALPSISYGRFLVPIMSSGKVSNSTLPSIGSSLVPMIPIALPPLAAIKSSQTIVSAINDIKSQSLAFESFVAPLSSGLTGGATQGKFLASQVPANLAAISKSASVGAVAFKNVAGTIDGSGSDAIAKGMADLVTSQLALLKAMTASKSSISKYGSISDVRSSLVETQKSFDSFSAALISLIPLKAGEEKALQKLFDSAFEVAINFYN